MAKIFSGKNKCTRCNNIFEWETYYLDKHEAFFGIVKKNVKKTIKLNHDEYQIILNCPKCGQGDEVLEKK